MSQTSEREFYIEYDDQLLGVSIVCIWGVAGYYAMWLFELFVHTSFVTASSNWTESAVIFRTSTFWAIF